MFDFHTNFDISTDSDLGIYGIGADGEGKDEWVNMDLDEAEDSDDQEDDQMGFVHKQPLVATGMAATLALLKGSG